MPMIARYSIRYVICFLYDRGYDKLIKQIICVVYMLKYML